MTESALFNDARDAVWAGKRVRRASWPAGSFIALVDGDPKMHIDGKPVPFPPSGREFTATDWEIADASQD